MWCYDMLIYNGAENKRKRIKLQCKCGSIFDQDYRNKHEKLMHNGQRTTVALACSLGKRGKRRLLNEILFTMFYKNSISKKLLTIRIVFVIWSLSYEPSSIVKFYLIHYFNYVYEVKLGCIVGKLSSNYR